MVRVAHVAEAFTGGIATYMRLCLPGLVRMGYDVTLICSLNRRWPDADAALAEMRRAGVTVHVVPMRRRISPWRDVVALRRVYRILVSGQYGVVHTHGSKGGALGRLAAWLAGTSVVVHTPHCFAFLRCGGKTRRWFYGVVERLLGSLTHVLICVSRDELRTAKQAGICKQAERIHVSNGLPLCAPERRQIRRSENRLTRESLGIEPNAVVVMTACRLVQYKGLHRFLETARASRATGVMFVIAGEGELRAGIEEWISKHGLSSKVILLGHVSDMKWLYEISDIVVFASEAEGQPYVLLEAMRAGKAVAAMSAPWSKDVIRHNQNGCLFPPDALHMARAIDSLASDARIRDRYGRNAYRDFQKRHLLETQLAGIATAYEGGLKRA